MKVIGAAAEMACQRTVEYTHDPSRSSPNHIEQENEGLYHKTSQGDHADASRKRWIKQCPVTN